MSDRVLVVDDEDDIREIARLSLERLGGWTVVTASSGDEALELVDRGILDADQLRDFLFVNPARFYGSLNPEFFAGTAIAAAADNVLRTSH